LHQVGLLRTQTALHTAKNTWAAGMLNEVAVSTN